MALDTNLALITLADAKLYLKITAVTEDVIVSDLINECSEWINSYCDRRFIAPSSDYVEYHDGDGSRQLFPRQWPIISVTSLYDDPLRAWTGETVIDLESDVQVDNEAGSLTLWNNRYQYRRGIGNVRVTYRAGYVHNSNVPYDLQLACRKLVAWKYFQDYSQRRFGVSSESTGDRQVNYTEEALLPDVEQILDGYRRLSAR